MITGWLLEYKAELHRLAKFRVSDLAMLRPPGAIIPCEEVTPSLSFKILLLAEVLIRRIRQNLRF